MRVGDYVLSAELHRSQLGTLHLARHIADVEGAPMRVVRTLAESNLGSQEMCSMVVREGVIGPRIRSRHVVAVYAAEDAERPYSVMEHVDVLSLEQVLRRARHSPEIARLLVPAVVDALVGLSALHQLVDPQSGRGLAHQAPVPRHIMVGVDGVARLVDLTQSVGAGFVWTQQASHRLRPEEMAPEQALAPAHVDERCDIFIAAGTLWHVLVGTPLFAGDAPEQSLQRMLRMPIPSLVEAGVRSGAALDRLIFQALSRDRGERLASALEFAESLRTHAQRAGMFGERAELGELVRSLQRARMLTSDAGQARE
jgi:hypothetical protein